ncbi:hypothetical protein CMV_001883 [Castanea mollissima]|uniref:Uncharacterized protein n=1 Tax=Castanea mollissima TaxID=60419 RepID=A0A8J4RVD5_9ROSI|nr:hypothetical protein CMV_001883 [Castanea mollissima]
MVGPAQLPLSQPVAQFIVVIVVLVAAIDAIDNDAAIVVGFRLRVPSAVAATMSIGRFVFAAGRILVGAAMGVVGQTAVFKEQGKGKVLAHGVWVERARVEMELRVAKMKKAEGFIGSFFNYNSSLGPPYRVLVDTNFINLSIQNKPDLEKGMMDCRYAKCEFRIIAIQ